MKSIEGLGRVLSRLEQKKVIGGDTVPGETWCSENEECSYYEAHTGNVTGVCEKRSTDGKCVCRAEHSSVLHDPCYNG